MINPLPRTSKRFRASEAERASIRALKNWLFAAPPENPLEEQLVRLRISEAIAILSEANQASREIKKPG